MGYLTPFDTPLPDIPLRDTPLPDTPLRDTPLRDTPLPDTPLSGRAAPSIAAFCQQKKITFNSSDADRIGAAITYFRRFAGQPIPPGHGNASGKPVSGSFCASMFRISYGQFKHHLKNPSMGTKASIACRKMKLKPEEEAILVKHILQISCREKTPVSLQEVRSLANSIIAPRCVGKNWHYKFLTRHKDELKYGYVDSIEHKRLQAEDWNSVKDWFDKYSSILQDTDRNFIFNVDESGCNPLDTKKRKRITHVEYAAKDLLHRISNHITTVECISAGGFAIPPMVIFADSASLPASYLKRSVYERNINQWLVAGQTNGYMTTNLFLAWLQHFDANTDNSKTRVLLVDNFRPHLADPVKEFAEEKNILICPFLPNLSHVVQPLDVGFFGPLKSALSAEMDQGQHLGLNYLINETEWIRMYYDSRERVLRGRSIERSFEESGIYPFHPEALKRRLADLIREEETLLGSEYVGDPATPSEVSQGTFEPISYVFNSDSSPSDREGKRRAVSLETACANMVKDGPASRLEFEKVMISAGKNGTKAVEKWHYHRSTCRALQADVVCLQEERDKYHKLLVNREYNFLQRKLFQALKKHPNAEEHMYGHTHTQNTFETVLEQQLEQFRRKTISKAFIGNFLEEFVKFSSAHPEITRETINEKAHIVCRHCNLSGHQRTTHKDCLMNPRRLASVGANDDGVVRSTEPINIEEDGIVHSSESSNIEDEEESE